MSIQRATEWGGSYHLNDTDGDLEGGNFYGFTVQEDNTVVSVFSGSFEGVDMDFLTDPKYNVNISGKQLKAGALIVVDLGGTVKKITVNSGSIILHKSS